MIFSNPRVAPGHLLVIPKRHIEKLIELSEKEKSEILDFLSLFQERILDKLASGTEIRQNFKPYMAESRIHVNHLHFHIIPRELGDEIYEKIDKHRTPLYLDLPKEERERLFKILND